MNDEVLDQSIVKSPEAAATVLNDLGWTVELPRPAE